MVGLGAGRSKAKATSRSFGASADSKAEEGKSMSFTDLPLPTNLTLKFDTNVRLQRNTVLATVVVLNAFVTAALIVAALLASAYVQHELSNSQHKIVALQEQVKLLTDRYDYVLKQLSAQHTISSQDDYNSVRSGEPGQHPETEEPSLVVTKDMKEQTSAGAPAAAETFSPLSFTEEPLMSREVAVESDGSQYGTQTLRRSKRSDRRGKQSQRKASNGGRGRQRRRGKFSGVAVAHFKGGQPETFIRDGGSLVAPWFLDDSASGQFGFSAFQLKQGKAAVEVSESGLYYIYSQIHYLTSQVTNSYSLNLRHGSQSNSSVLSYCSASSGSQSLNEVSCFTSVVRYLNSTDRVFIQQRDMNRRIILRDGYSYLGVVRLNT